MFRCCRQLQRPREAVGLLERGFPRWRMQDPGPVSHLRTIAPPQVLRQGDGQDDPQRARLCRRGKTPHSTPTETASPPAAGPMAPAASQSLSHSLNTVYHCCPLWQAQICPRVLESHVPSLLSFSMGGETGHGWGGGGAEGREPYCSLAKLGWLDTS